MTFRFLILLLAVAACSASAPRIDGRETIPFGGSFFLGTGDYSDVLLLHGPIDARSADVFDRLVTQSGRAIRTIAISSSPGGDRQRAAQIAQAIKGRGMNTWLTGQCLDSCAEIFLAGTSRMMEANAILGIPTTPNRFVSYALDQLPVDTPLGATIGDAQDTMRLVNAEEALLIGLATEIR